MMLSRKRIAAVVVTALVCMIMPAFAGAAHAEETEQTGQTEQMYTLDAQAVDLDAMPGVYTVQAKLGDSLAGKKTIGIPSVAQQTLADKPTKEMPAIIMGGCGQLRDKSWPDQLRADSGG